MTLAKALAFITVIGGAGGWIHSHAADAIEQADFRQRRLINMNTAEIQLFKTTQEFERLVLKPFNERTEYDSYNLQQLIDDMDHWKSRVREIEST